MKLSNKRENRQIQSKRKQGFLGEENDKKLAWHYRERRYGKVILRNRKGGQKRPEITKTNTSWDGATSKKGTYSRGKRRGRQQRNKKVKLTHKEGSE